MTNALELAIDELKQKATHAIASANATAEVHLAKVRELEAERDALRQEVDELREDLADVDDEDADEKDDSLHPLLVIFLLIVVGPLAFIGLMLAK